MSAAGVRAPRLGAPRFAEERLSLLERVRLLLPAWGARRDPLLALAIDDEIENHILERTEMLMEQGMSASAARREAERRFGNVRRVRHSLEKIGGSDGGGSPWRDLFGSMGRDLRQGVRALAKAPGFALAVILTIGLGVGANTALFSVTDAVLLRPLPYAAPDELVSIEVYSAEVDGVIPWVSPAHARAWSGSVAGLTELTRYARQVFVRTDGADAQRVAAHAVSIDWLDTLGVAPWRGRPFNAGDLAPDAAPVVILSHDYWAESFDQDPGVIGSTLELDRRRYTVVGVMDEDFKFPPLGPNDAWVPLDAVANPAVAPERVNLVARLGAGVVLPEVQERLDATLVSLEQEGIAPDGATSARIRPFDNIRANRDVERALWVLTGAVGIMLLIAAINAANLLLLRATARAAEDSVRLALGASRGRLVRQHLTENLLLVAGGGAVAVVLARLVLGSIVRLLPSEITFFLTGRVALDLRVLLFALAVTTLTGLLLSLVPALRATRIVQPQLSSARTSAAPGASLLRNALVVAEVAMTVTLLVGAGLMVNSFLRLTSVDPGYDPDNLAQLSLNLPQTRYPDAPSRARFFDELSASIAAIPGVRRVALSDGAPPGGATIFFGMVPQAEGYDPRPYPGDFMNAIYVDESFFRTLEATIVMGRDFSGTDGSEAGNVIVDRDTARFFWGDQDPVGRRFKLDSEDPDEPWLTVVGVVDEFKLWGLDDRQGSLDFFFPRNDERVRAYMSLMVRTAVDPVGLFPAIRDALRDLDPELPLYQLTTATQSLSDSVDKPRFFLRMMVIFAGTALGLAVIGTYGVLAFTVRRRQRELGVRIALGADGGRLKAMVLRQGLGLAGAGVGLGAAGAVLLGGVARALLFEVEPTDPLTFTAVAGVMLGCAALACWVPAHRATRVDPVEVLRAE